MTEIYELKAQKREETGRKSKLVREQGSVPAVVYGAGSEPQNVSVPAIEFLKVYRKAGESSLVDLSIADGEPLKVLIQDIQLDPVRDTVRHIDFRQVRMDEKIETDIVLSFVGESPAVKGLGGVLIRSMDSLSVRCFPGALVQKIEVPLESLITFQDKIQIKDIKIPEGIEVMDDVESTVALVEAPRTEEEMKQLDEAPTDDGVAGVEVTTEKKKEEDAEGEKTEEAASEEKKNE